MILQSAAGASSPHSESFGPQLVELDLVLAFHYHQDGFGKCDEGRR